MASTEQILDAASKLGELIAEHPASKKLESMLGQLQNDTTAQRALADYNRHLQTLSEKEAQGSPIEVEDKRKLEEFQRAVVLNPLLRDFQTAQMDYVDLMRRVDEAMTGQAANGAAPASPLVNPNLSSPFPGSA